MKPALRPLAGPLAGAAVLAVLAGSVGTGPFMRALAGLTVPAVATALVVTAVTTGCCAWRWTWTARRLGLELDVRSALGAYYRSQLLNVTLPGGVLGDVHRAVRHGVEVAAVPGAARAVVWERAVGQVLLVAGAVVAMAWLPAEARTPAYVGLAVAGRRRPGAGRRSRVLGGRRGGPARPPTCTASPSAASGCRSRCRRSPSWATCWCC